MSTREFSDITPKHGRDTIDLSHQKTFGEVQPSRHTLDLSEVQPKTRPVSKRPKRPNQDVFFEAIPLAGARFSPREKTIAPKRVSWLTGVKTASFRARRHLRASIRRWLFELNIWQQRRRQAIKRRYLVALLLILVAALVYLVWQTFYQTTPQKSAARTSHATTPSQQSGNQSLQSQPSSSAVQGSSAQGVPAASGVGGGVTGFSTQSSSGNSSSNQGGSNLDPSASGNVTLPSPLPGLNYNIQINP